MMFKTRNRNSFYSFQFPFMWWELSRGRQACEGIASLCYDRVGVKNEMVCNGKFKSEMGSGFVCLVWWKLICEKKKKAVGGRKLSHWPGKMWMQHKKGVMGSWDRWVVLSFSQFLSRVMSFKSRQRTRWREMDDGAGCVCGIKKIVGSSVLK